VGLDSIPSGSGPVAVFCDECGNERSGFHEKWKCLYKRVARPY
jgi:hypothetical protein